MINGEFSMGLEVEFYLDKLENLLDEEHIKRTHHLQSKAFDFQSIDHIPTQINYPVSEDEWPKFSYMDIYDDPSKMLVNELKEVYLGAKLKDDRLYGIRANYGTGIIASMFGCQVVAFDHSLPTAVHISKDKLEEILINGVPNIKSGIMGKAIDTVSFFREQLKPYPKLSKYIGSQLLDIQGTFDNANMIWGTDIYYAFYDEPDKIHRLMDIVSQTILEVVRQHRKIDGCPLNEQDGKWNHLGGICLRNDSCVTLSRENYEEFVKPYDKMVIEPYGGWIHFCGDANAWWKKLLDIPGLTAVNPYQGQFYDLFEMFELCENSRIAIVQWATSVNSQCKERIKTGFSRVAWVDSFQDACKMKEKLYKFGHID